MDLAAEAPSIVPGSIMPDDSLAEVIAHLGAARMQGITNWIVVADFALRDKNCPDDSLASRFPPYAHLLLAQSG